MVMDFDALLASAASTLLADPSLLRHKTELAAIDQYREYLSEDRCLRLPIPTLMAQGEKIETRIILKSYETHTFLLPVSGWLMIDCATRFVDYDYSDCTQRVGTTGDRLKAVFPNNWPYWLERHPDYDPGEWGREFIVGTYAGPEEDRLLRHLAKADLKEVKWKKK
jgi:hypothetical protein